MDILLKSFFIIRQGVVVCDTEEGPRSSMFNLGESKFSNFETNRNFR